MLQITCLEGGSSQPPSKFLCNVLSNPASETITLMVSTGVKDLGTGADKLHQGNFRRKFTAHCYFDFAS